MQLGCCAGALTPTVGCVSFFVGLQRDGVPHDDRPPPPVPRASCAVCCRRALRCAVRSSQPIRRSRARSAPARAPANCCSVLLPVCDPPAGAPPALRCCRSARRCACRSRLVGVSPGAGQRPCPRTVHASSLCAAPVPFARLPARGLLPALAAPCCVQSSNGRTPQPAGLLAAAHLWPYGLLCVQCG